MSDTLLMLLEMIEEVLEEQKIPRVNRGELVEELIVKATGGTTKYFDPPDEEEFKKQRDKKKTEKTRLAADEKHKRNIAKYHKKIELQNNHSGSIDESVKATPEIEGKKLQKLGTQTLPENGIYVKFGVKSGVPKTDLIDPAGKPKYSAKDSAGAQFVSAQGPESAALWYVSLKAAAGEKDLNSAVTNALDKVPQDIKDYFAPKNFVPIKKSGPEVLQEHLQNIHDKIFNSILEEIGVKKPDFMNQFYIEGMTGKVKFNNGKGSADTMLSWNLDGKPFEIKEIEAFIAEHMQQLNIRVSDRGHSRGGAIRGDIKKPKSNVDEGIKDIAGAILLGLSQLINPKADMPPTPPDEIGLVSQDPDGEQIKPPETGFSEDKIITLAEEIKTKLKQIYEDRGPEVGLVDLLDYLKTGGTGEYVNMSPLYAYFGKTTEPYDPSLPPKWQ
jgi:hypothetical protein